MNNMETTDKTLGLYVHIPFCAVKCPYCDFYSVKYSKSQEEEYVKAIIQHMKSYKGKGITADTLYFGGGTPSLIQPQNIDKIIKTAIGVFALDGEITLEANPNTISEKRVQAYSKSGINRISIGMQSADEKELSALGRSHSVEQVENAIKICIANGIENISLDLMIGTPFQTMQSLEKSLEKISTLPVKHISAYMLKVEENTPFYNNNILSNCGDEDLVAELYLKTGEALKDYGFEQYEISSYAKKGCESHHNLKYWKCEDYIGFGASAHSSYENRRFCHPNNIDEYIKTKGKNEINTDTNANTLEEYIMLGLRLSGGIDLDELTKRFSVKQECLENFWDKYISYGLMKFEGNKISLTPQGFLVSNSLILAVIEQINKAL